MEVAAKADEVDELTAVKELQARFKPMHMQWHVAEVVKDSDAKEKTPAVDTAVTELQLRLGRTETELAELKQQYATKVPALELKNADLENQVTDLKHKVQKLERDARKLEHDAKIDGPIMASWKDNVSENLATLNSKQSTAEWEAVYSKRMSSMYQENQMKMAKMEAEIEQLRGLLVKV
jgi:predicted  nucleic acid-binding Zn-ribbon protein